MPILMVIRHTITDEATGVECSVTVADPQSTNPRVVAITFAALEGGALMGDHLSKMLQHIGLSVPALAGGVVPKQTRRIPATGPKRKPKPATQAGGGGGQPTSTPPPLGTDQQLALEQSTQVQTTDSSGSRRRPYRTSPPDLAQVFRQCGSQLGVAEYYRVPRHTAGSWILRARRDGLIPPAAKRKGASK